MSYVIVATHSQGEPTVCGPFATRDEAEAWLVANQGQLGPNPVNISIQEQVAANG